WRLSRDMAYFKRLTMGKPDIMGRKTCESLPRKPLPGRTNIGVTRDAGYAAEGAELAMSASAALALGRALPAQAGADEITGPGSAQLNAVTFARAARLYITDVHAAPEGDVSMPAFDRRHWREVSPEPHAAGENGSADYSIVVLQRVW